MGEIEIKSIIIPLGILVETKDENAIEAFQAIVANYSTDKTIKVINLIKDLKPLFDNFNQNKITVEAFRARVREVLKLDENIEDKEIDEAWCAQCVINDDVQQTIRTLVAKMEVYGKDLKIYVHSDTNQLHLEYLKEKLAALGFKGKIYATCEEGMSMDKLLPKILGDIEKATGEKATAVFFGDANFVRDPNLKARLLERDGGLFKILDELKIQKIVIKGRSLKKAELEESLDTILGAPKSSTTPSFDSSTDKKVEETQDKDKSKEKDKDKDKDKGADDATSSAQVPSGGAKPKLPIAKATT